MVWNYRNADSGWRKKNYCVIYYNFRHTFVPHGLDRFMGWVGLVWVESQQHKDLPAESAYCDDCASDSFYWMILALSRILLLTDLITLPINRLYTVDVLWTVPEAWTQSYVGYTVQLIPGTFIGAPLPLKSICGASLSRAGFKCGGPGYINSMTYTQWQ